MEIFLGAIIGLILGLTGAGGGILAVPALVIGLGFPMTMAAPVALVAVGMGAAVGAADGLKRGLVRYKASMLMAAAGAATSPAGSWLAHRLPTGWLMLVFGVIMVFVAWRSYGKARSSDSTDTRETENKVCLLSPRTGHFIWNWRMARVLAAIGALSGVLTGMLGVGGGFVIVPALQRFTNVTMHGIVATSLMVIALISGATVWQAFSNGLQWPSRLNEFVAFTILGMAAGRYVSSKVPARILQYAFAALCVAVSGVMVAKGIGG